jgi:hypothetical protein
MISARDIDRLLLFFCNTRWLKVARIIGNTMEILERHGIRINAKVGKMIDARMAVLVRNEQFETKGNIRHWRYSEIRLPARFSKQQNRIPASLLRNNIRARTNRMRNAYWKRRAERAN